MTTICQKCRKPTLTWTLVLYKGQNGFRKYKLCPACQTAVQYGWKSKIKAVRKP